MADTHTHHRLAPSSTHCAQAHAYSLTHPILWMLLILTGFGTLANGQGGPFKIEGKPPSIGYFTQSDQPVDPDLIEIEMIAQITSVFSILEPRSFSTLRRKLSRDPIDPDALTDENQIAVLHMHRRKVHKAMEIHWISDELLAMRSVDDPTQVWGIASDVFDRVGVDWPSESNNDSATGNQREEARASAWSGSGSNNFVLAQPYVESQTVLDLRTIRARIKNRYPALTRSLDQETFRVRLPKKYNADFPAGVLVWISPMPDGRIPKIFEPILDELGMIAIGVDNNGNKRAITDRLQNHLDSIETLAQHYRIDRKRIYLTGMSGGGRCSGILQIVFPELFAGAVPIVGFDTYHQAPTGDPGRFWPARLGKPAGRWMKLLKERRIAAITGTNDFNEPEMGVRKDLLSRDGIEIRLDIIEG
ncbi:MAG: hypothetical protein JKX70_04405, partial [Phycisphaerales bacterium]|nr:hypothetical protein [Phycisphaerales bacterium]